MRLLLHVAASAAPGKAQQQSLGGLTAQKKPHLIDLAYHSGWERPVIHHSICGAEWRTRPMTKVRGALCSARTRGSS